MKILILNNNPIEIEELQLMINSLYEHCQVDVCQKADDAMCLYMHTYYDSIFVNYDFYQGKKFTQLIQKDKEQQLIAISAIFDCQEKLDCKFCKESKSKYKLMKPISYNDLIRVLNKQKVKHHNYCDNNSRLLKLKKIEKKYHNFYLDAHANVLVNKNSFLKREQNLESIMNELHQYNISYRVDEIKNIQLVNTPTTQN